MLHNDQWHGYSLQLTVDHENESHNNSVVDKTVYKGYTVCNEWVPRQLSSKQGNPSREAWCLYITGVTEMIVNAHGMNLDKGNMDIGLGIILHT